MSATQLRTVLTLPGLGRRKPVPPLEVLADEVIDRLGPDPVVFAGHSQSGHVVAAVAESDPRVVAVVLLGPTTDPRLRRPGGVVGAWLRTAVGEPWWQAPRVDRGTRPPRRDRRSRTLSGALAREIGDLVGRGSPYWPSVRPRTSA